MFVNNHDVTLKQVMMERQQESTWVTIAWHALTATCKVVCKLLLPTYRKPFYLSEPPFGLQEDDAAAI